MLYLIITASGTLSSEDGGCLVSGSQLQSALTTSHQIAFLFSQYSLHFIGCRGHFFKNLGKGVEEAK